MEDQEKAVAAASKRIERLERQRADYAAQITSLEKLLTSLSAREPAFKHEVHTQLSYTVWICFDEMLILCILVSPVDWTDCSIHLA